MVFLSLFGPRGEDCHPPGPIGLLIYTSLMRLERVIYIS
jgi:hypothetical protein